MPWTMLEMESIDIKETIDNIIKWLTAIKKSGCKGVVLGLSGGKDSTVVAMLAKKVWGKRVRAVIMPNQNWTDTSTAMTIAHKLDIEFCIHPIGEAYNILNEKTPLSKQAQVNLAPRLRMASLYAIGQTLGYRVIGTGNRSERYIGWCTKFGDMGCDFNPIAHLTCGQVIEIGLYLADEMGLPRQYIEIPPADGLTGKTDEDNFGFTYEQLDNYILSGTSGDKKVDRKIEKMHANSTHKMIMPLTIAIE